MEWIKLSISPVKDLISFLNKKSKTNDIAKRQLFIELRDNLNVFSNGFLNESPYDNIIELLSNSAIQQAVKENFSYNKLKKGVIKEFHIKDDRNKKYKGWNCEKLIEKIDEKITELKNIKKLNNGTVAKAKNNIPMMMSNLYFRMRLLADFIRART